MGRDISKDTFDRLHRYSCQGEKHDSLVLRLIADCKAEKKVVNLSDETVVELKSFTGCSDVDEALNALMDMYEVVRK